jgi:hypothetical protein
MVDALSSFRVVPGMILTLTSFGSIGPDGNLWNVSELSEVENAPAGSVSTVDPLGLAF